jgi:hypothetical protein
MELLHADAEFPRPPICCFYFPQRALLGRVAGALAPTAWRSTKPSRAITSR